MDNRCLQWKRKGTRIGFILLKLVVIAIAVLGIVVAILVYLAAPQDGWIGGCGLILAILLSIKFGIFDFYGVSEMQKKCDASETPEAIV